MSYQDDTPVTDDVIADEAIRAPKLLMDASSGLLEDSTREPGLILTKEQLVNIKKYEMAGLALPTEIGAVITHLNYDVGDGAGKGLEPKDFQQTYTLIRNHALTWNPLRQDMMDVGSKLQVFAGLIKNNGASIEEIYDNVKALKKLSEYNIEEFEDIRKLQDELRDRLPEFALDQSDKITISQFSYYLGNILKGVDDQKNDADNIKKRLGIFATYLAENVLPAIKSKVKAIDNSDLPQTVKTLSETIAKKAEEIDTLDADYKKTVKLALEAASTLNIVGIATSIYNGVAAEKLRKKRNELRKEQATRIAELQTKNKVIASLHRVQRELQDLDFIVVEADIATKNLQTAWNKITIFVDDSHKGLNAINDALSLVRFMYHFRAVVKPWEMIGTKADLLYEVFIQADKAFLDKYPSEQPQKSPRMMRAMRMSDPLIFEAPDMKVLQAAKDDCNSKMVAITVHHDVTGYLPNAVDKIEGLNKGLNNAHSDLTTSAQDIFYALQMGINKVDGAQKDLADAGDADRDFFQKEISGIRSTATDTTRNETNLLAQHLQSLNEAFNRTSTLSSLNGLKIDAIKLPEAIAALEERKNALTNDLDTLANAIGAIEGKGFAAIGEDAILNAETLAALQLGGPPAAAVAAGLELLKKSLAVLDTSLNFQGLLKLRENLKTRIDVETQNIINKQGELRQVNQRTKLVEAVHGFVDERATYSAEYAKIIKSLQSFVKQYNAAPTEGDKSMVQWIQDARALMNYVSAF